MHVLVITISIIIIYFHFLHTIYSIQLLVEDPCRNIPKELLCPSNDWLKFVLLPKLAKWAAIDNVLCETTPILDTPLVPLEDYYTLYKYLKEKYSSYLIQVSAATMILYHYWYMLTLIHNYYGCCCCCCCCCCCFQNWCESTDPYKFVYEDIAIATYLLV